VAGKVKCKKSKKRFHNKVLKAILTIVRRMYGREYQIRTVTWIKIFYVKI
jgi:hypothetical protein